MIKSFSKYIDQIGESSPGQIVFSTENIKEVVFSTKDPDTFSQDLSVSLLGGKTFGKYKNGDLIPASGKSVKDIVLMALSEAVNEVDKYSDSTFAFDKNLSIELINNQIKSLSSDPNDFINKKGQLEVPIGFKRLNSFPLDSSSVFQTLSGLQSYAQTNLSAYYGQICSVTENEKIYIIKGDRSVKEIGADSISLLGYATSGDLSGYYPNTNPSGFLNEEQVNQKILDAGFGLGSEDIVYTTGDQNISGLKTFNEGLQVGVSSSVATLFVKSGLVGVNNESPQGALDVSGSVFFNERPAVNGTVVLLSGDIDISNFYANNNPSGFITVVDLSNYAENSDIFNAAVEWTVNHTLADGTRYLAGDLVYSSGKVYKANYDNESLPVTDTAYWTDLGPGYRLNIDGRDIPNIPQVDVSNLYPKSLSFNLETGLSALNVSFPVIFTSVPSVNCSIDGGEGVIYQTLIKNKTVSGFDVYFSDSIGESGCILNVSASITSNY